MTKLHETDSALAEDVTDLGVATKATMGAIPFNDPDGVQSQYKLHTGLSND